VQEHQIFDILKVNSISTFIFFAVFALVEKKNVRSVKENFHIWHISVKLRHRTEDREREAEMKMMKEMETETETKAKLDEMPGNC